MKTTMKNFFSPGAEFRGAPFWAWNAKLNRDELIRQIHIFKEMGLGGFFMHSRVGLDTPYLGKDWFDCVKACVAEAKKLGLLAYLYDEDRWPSGAAGGIVTKDDAFKSRWCEAQFFSSAAEAEKKVRGEPLAWYSAVVSGSFEKKNLTVKSPRRLKSPEDFRQEKGRKLLCFAIRLMDGHNWFNGGTYLDMLNPDAVRKFIKTTHEAYAARIGDEFGKTVPAIFSDEPMFFWTPLSSVIVPWTDRLPDEFLAAYGVDVYGFLPEIFFPSVRKKSLRRMQFLNLATGMFCRAFAKTIGMWCIKATGRKGW